MRHFVQRSLVEPHRLVELLASGEQDLVAQGAVARVVALRDIDRRRCPGEVRLPGEDPAVLAVVGAFGAVVVRRDVLAGCAALALSARERRVPARTAFGEQLAHGVVVFAGVLGPFGLVVDDGLERRSEHASAQLVTLRGGQHVDGGRSRPVRPAGVGPRLASHRGVSSGSWPIVAMTPRMASSAPAVLPSPAMLRLGFVVLPWIGCLVPSGGRRAPRCRSRRSSAAGLRAGSRTR